MGNVAQREGVNRLMKICQDRPGFSKRFFEKLEPPSEDYSADRILGQTDEWHTIMGVLRHTNMPEGPTWTAWESYPIDGYITRDALRIMLGKRRGKL